MTLLNEVLKVEPLRKFACEYLVPVPMDNPGVHALRTAIRLRREWVSTFNEEHPTIPKEIDSLFPHIGPLHLSLNMRETFFTEHQDFLRLAHRMVAGKEMTKKPSPQVIDYLVTVLACAW
ncbi:hypothetical protein BCR44DRAFT_122283, partial [Catenaria anguillulae PL171]